MLVSRVLAPLVVAISLLAGTLGASSPSAPLAGPAGASPSATAPVVPAPAESATPAPSRAGAASPGGASPGAATYDDSAESRVVAVLPRADLAVPDFGEPPSGQIPILLNDRHVYAKPDQLRAGRLLAALVRDGAILVPLRSLFAQLGATVTYDVATKTAIAHKAGTEIKLVVGRHEAVIDGTTRPLDVPPIQVGTAILVPVRVIAEVFGAYVQWLPDRHAVAIRYLAPSALAPAEGPVALATALATPGPRRTVGPGPALPKAPPSNETFIAIDPLLTPRVANAFAPAVLGSSGTSFSIRGVDEFDFFGGQFEIGARYTKNHYAHRTGPVTVIGGNGVTNVGAFIANDYALDADFGVALTPEKFYLAASYAKISNNYGYPRLGGIGLGLSKLPVLDRRLSYEGEFFYYPSVSGTCSTVACPTGPFKLTYKLFRYSVGLTALLGHRVFAEVGLQGDKGIGKAYAPDGFTHSGAFGGLGVRF